MPLTIKDVFSTLDGTWALSRVIQDGKTHHFQGQAVFNADGSNRYIYEEKGTLELEGGGLLQAERSYVYELDGDTLKILYNDPHRKDEIMHEMRFNEDKGVLTSQHCHLCVDDNYDLTMIFNENGSIEMKYKISGPKKHYSIETVLTPA